MIARSVFRLTMVCLGVLSCSAGLVGCASSQEPTRTEIRVAPGEYAEAFESAKRVLRRQRFALERVDAAAGVITTKPKRTAGLATPWDLEQSTLRQEWGDFINDQQRRVRVVFAPAGELTDDRPRPQAAPGEAAPDLRTLDQPIVGRVEVVVERRYRPGWRIPPVSARRASFAFDPIFASRIGRRYTVPRSQDRRLATRLSDEIDTLREAGPARAPRAD